MSIGPSKNSNSLRVSRSERRVSTSGERRTWYLIGILGERVEASMVVATDSWPIHVVSIFYVSCDRIVIQRGGLSKCIGQTYLQRCRLPRLSFLHLALSCLHSASPTSTRHSTVLAELATLLPGRACIRQIQLPAVFGSPGLGMYCHTP